jgi:hypothetical protein
LHERLILAQKAEQPPLQRIQAKSPTPSMSRRFNDCSEEETHRRSRFESNSYDNLTRLPAAGNSSVANRKTVLDERVLIDSILSLLENQ